MTPEQAKIIMTEIMPGYWPDWEVTDAQISSWLKELQKFDFPATKKVIEKMHFSRAGSYKNPPAGKLLDELKAKATVAAVARKAYGGEPLLLYEIIPDNYTRGMKFYMPSGKPQNQEQVTIEAEQKRQSLVDSRGVPHTIYYADWEAELEERKNPTSEPLHRLTDDDLIRLQCEILDGPDRPAKRFLQWYLTRDRKDEKNPDHISSGLKL